MSPDKVNKDLPYPNNQSNLNELLYKTPKSAPKAPTKHYSKTS